MFMITNKQYERLMEAYAKLDFSKFTGEEQDVLDLISAMENIRDTVKYKGRTS